MFNGIRKPLKTAVFISGGGSTLQALLEMQHQLEISLVISNNKNALGLLKAKRFGKNTLFFDFKNNSFDELNDLLVQQGIQKIILAGFMKIIPKNFVDNWQDRIFNIHPSLLPEYPGLRSAERSWEDKNIMGVSIHKVIPEMDQGKIILQNKALVNSDRFSFSESMFFLRRTEQHLLREFSLRWGL